jgi:dephospho-CoA kinase
MILGLTGTNGAGKGTVMHYLMEKGFVHYGVRGFLVAEIEKRKLEVDRSSMRETANALRQENGPDYVIEELYKKAKAAGGDGVIESIRVIGEVEFLKAHDIPLIAVAADRKARYERIVARGSATDKVDYDTWVAQEEREWASIAAWDMDVPGVMGRADYTLTNNGSIEELQEQVDEVLKKLKYHAPHSRKD